MENSSLLQKSISKKNDLCQEEENKLCAIAKTTFINEKGRFRQKRKRKSLDTRLETYFRKEQSNTFCQRLL